MTELYTALAALKADLGTTIHVDSQGQYGAYASLDTVLAKLEPLTKKHGLLINQSLSTLNDSPVLLTSIVHLKSGTAFASDYLLNPEGPGPQKMGAAITYARRFALMTMFGLVSEGDPDASPGVQTTKPTERRPAATPSVTMPRRGGASDYEITWGKYKGKRLGELSFEEVDGYIAYLTRKSTEEGKPLSHHAVELQLALKKLEQENEYAPSFADDNSFSLNDLIDGDR